MYFRSPSRTNNNTTYVFPRGQNGGVVLGGCRGDGDWNSNADPQLTEQIKKHAVKLCPKLGKVEDLKVLSVGVGFRRKSNTVSLKIKMRGWLLIKTDGSTDSWTASRKGGIRIEREMIDGKVVVHNYGAGGTGYQGSWGMAKEAVDLLWPEKIASKL
jgi:glycine/D-amino acid oxidase-like deaminating enzyme